MNTAAGMLYIPFTSHIFFVSFYIYKVSALKEKTCVSLQSEYTR